MINKFFSYVEVQGECWIWQGPTWPNGYGSFSFEGTNHSAHRTSYELFVGPIPEGYDIDHLCRVRNCVQPKHLEAVTRKENLRRGVGHGSETHCPHGHPYDETNTWRHPTQGHRICKICKANTKRLYRARKRAMGEVPK